MCFDDCNDINEPGGHGWRVCTNANSNPSERKSEESVHGEYWQPLNSLSRQYVQFDRWRAQKHIRCNPSELTIYPVAEMYNDQKRLCYVWKLLVRLNEV